MTADQIRSLVLQAFPEVEITFKPDLQRQRIIDTWPADLNDNDARRDWGWLPDYDADRSFNEYLIPNIVKRYQD